MSPNEFLFWTIIGVMIAVEVFGGLICWLYIKEVDQCHR